MRPGSSTLLVSAGLVAGLATSTWTVGGAANAPPTGQTRMARLAAKAATIPVAANRCPARLVQLLSVLPRTFVGVRQHRTIHLSLLHPRFPLATTARGEGESGGEMFLGDVAAGIVE